MLVEKNVPLQPFNTFGIVAKALQLARITSDADVAAVLADPALRPARKFVLGGGSNIVLTGDVKPLTLKVEIMGKRLHSETAKAWIVEAGAGLPGPGKHGVDSRLRGRVPRAKHRRLRGGTARPL